MGPGHGTSSLWLSEGCTSYFADLFVARAGLMTAEQYLASLSSAIGSLQRSPGRLLQSLEQSSMEVWSNSNSGVGAAASTVSYYTKGQVVGFLLDARIRALTGGERSLRGPAGASGCAAPSRLSRSGVTTDTRRGSAPGVLLKGQHTD